MENTKRKRFHKSDSTIFQFITIQLPFNSENTRQENLFRELVFVHAADGVHWQDISKEIHRLREDVKNGVPLGSGHILQTVMVDYPDFVVALTLGGAISIIEDLIKSLDNQVPHPYKYFKQVDTFAKEMVAQRDKYKWEASLPKGDHPIKDLHYFWPKD